MAAKARATVRARGGRRRSTTRLVSTAHDEAALLAVLRAMKKSQFVTQSQFPVDPPTREQNLHEASMLVGSGRCVEASEAIHAYINTGRVEKNAYKGFTTQSSKNHYWVELTRGDGEGRRFIIDPTWKQIAKEEAGIDGPRLHGLPTIFAGTIGDMRAWLQGLGAPNDRVDHVINNIYSGQEMLPLRRTRRTRQAAKEE